jgi:protein-L-isoaspartate(D-aspartate) O-methyltransferase
MAERPSFPVRLDLSVGKPQPKNLAVANPITIKNVAAPAISISSSSLNGPKTVSRDTDPSLPLGTADDARALRARLVALLVAQGISHPQVLVAMGAVLRHTFVDSALQAQAYEDTSLPIGLGQTISKPGVVARMLELMMGAPSLADAKASSMANGKPVPGRVLEIGTGCGYQAAVISQLVSEVYSMERLRGLHDKAREKLRPHRLANVHLLLGDGMLGYPKGAPYAAIVAAAGGEAIPQAWCEQLAIGGRIVAPVASGSGKQTLMVIDRTSQGFTRSVLEAVLFVPLKSGIA